VEHRVDKVSRAATGIHTATARHSPRGDGQQTPVKITGADQWIGELARKQKI
jgi:hypothetical protein